MQPRLSALFASRVTRASSTSTRAVDVQLAHGDCRGLSAARPATDASRPADSQHRARLSPPALVSPLRNPLSEAPPE
jgi:hypothetical protein